MDINDFKFEVSDTDKEYVMHYSCSNCGHVFIQMVQKGERAHQGKCPRCKVSPYTESCHDMDKKF